MPSMKHNFDTIKLQIMFWILIFLYIYFGWTSKKKLQFYSNMILFLFQTLIYTLNKHILEKKPWILEIERRTIHCFKPFMNKARICRRNFKLLSGMWNSQGFKLLYQKYIHKITTTVSTHFSTWWMLFMGFMRKCAVQKP